MFSHHAVMSDVRIPVVRCGPAAGGGVTGGGCPPGTQVFNLRPHFRRMFLKRISYSFYSQTSTLFYPPGDMPHAPKRLIILIIHESNPTGRAPRPGRRPGADRAGRGAVARRCRPRTVLALTITLSPAGERFPAAPRPRACHDRWPPHRSALRSCAHAPAREPDPRVR